MFLWFPRRPRSIVKRERETFILFNENSSGLRLNRPLPNGFWQSECDFVNCWQKKRQFSPVFQRWLNGEHEAVSHQTEHVLLHPETAVSTSVRYQDLEREEHIEDNESQEANGHARQK